MLPNFSILLKRELRFDDRQTAVGGVKESHWLWGTMKIVRSTYRDVVIASFLINLFVLTTPLFTMNIYDRVIPNDAKDTLWIFHCWDYQSGLWTLGLASW